MTEWTETRDFWIVTVSERDLMRVIANVAERYGKTDETIGDMVETRDTLLWLATRGDQGKDWGGAAVAARELDIWPYTHKGNRPPSG